MNGKVKSLFWLLYTNLSQCLRIDCLRFLLCYTRFVYYYRIRRNFRTYYPMNYKSDFLPGNKKEDYGTVEYNASYIKEKSFFEIYNQFSGYRSHRLVSALATYFSGSECLRNKKCLSIGPRTEAEIFSLVSLGAKLKDIKAIDIQTYSPKIIAADVIDIPFESNAFDCVIAGWVFPYVVEKQKAVDEIIRVCKNGALIAISHSWYPIAHNYSNGDFANGQSVADSEELIKYFSKHIQHTFFNFDQSKLDDIKVGDLILVFKIKK